MKKIVSYCLYRDRPKDVINAVINCFLMPKIYPGWIARFYVDDTVPLCIRQILETFDYVEVVNMPRNNTNEGMFWRFLPASEKDTVMISRDADSWISIREKVCVDEWLNSDKDFHIIRDHCYHSHKIMAGMWGSRNCIVPNMAEMIENFQKFRKGCQVFLAEDVYPNIINNALVHYGNPQYNNQGEIVNGYYNDGGIPIPEYVEFEEAIPGLSFKEANKLNTFFCAHCKKHHEVLIGGITENIPLTALELVKNYAKEKNIILDCKGF